MSEAYRITGKRRVTLPWGEDSGWHMFRLNAREPLPEEAEPDRTLSRTGHGRLRVHTLAGRMSFGLYVAGRRRSWRRADGKTTWRADRLRVRVADFRGSNLYAVTTRIELAEVNAACEAVLRLTLNVRAVFGAEARHRTQARFDLVDGRLSLDKKVFG